MNIIVFTLWGDDNKYWKGAVRNIEISSKLLPEWICHFYIDKNCKPELIDSISGDNVKVILMDSSDVKISNIERFNHIGLFWRFLPLSDKSIVNIISRDCDSRIGYREISAINEWIDSDKDFHIMRDHPYHGVPILSGMWGARNGILSNINELLSEWDKFENKGKYQAEDQDFLGQLIYPLVKENTFEHSEFGISFGGEIKKFTSERLNFEFVGDVFDENDERHPDFFKVIENIK